MLIFFFKCEHCKEGNSVITQRKEGTATSPIFLKIILSYADVIRRCRQGLSVGLPYYILFKQSTFSC